MSTHQGPPLLDTLNEAQRRAVTSPAPTVAILAGPGSGKTHTLTSRVVWLLEHQRLRPQTILVATFTVKAAREMRERIARHVGQARERQLLLGTFHSLARRFLAQHGHRIGLPKNFSIADETDTRGMLARIVKRLGLQEQVDVALVRAWISQQKTKTRDSPSDTHTTRPLPSSQGKQQQYHGGQITIQGNTSAKHSPPPQFQLVFDEYERQLELSHLVDFDDLLLKAVELLRQHPECVAGIEAVLIDEYQDTNGIQFELMKLFAHARQRITIVGDPDQSIYGWRSAEIRNLYRFLRDYPGTDEIALEENYRSSQQILASALAVIQQDTDRYQKILRPVHATGSRPVLRQLRTMGDEADWIVTESQRLLMMTGHSQLLTRDDIVILLRSASLSRILEAALGRAGIPYRMVGGLKFYDRAEIKALLDYLRVLYQPHNNDALARIINVPKRGLGVKTLTSLLEEAESSGISLWDLLQRVCAQSARGSAKTITTKTSTLRTSIVEKIQTELLSVVDHLRQHFLAQVSANADAPPPLKDLLTRLTDQIHFQSFLEGAYREDHETRWANVLELIGFSAEFARDMEANTPRAEYLEQNQGLGSLGLFLANIALAAENQPESERQKAAAKGRNKETDQDDPEEEKKTVPSRITISTIHAAKGLEWPVVFIPSVVEGVLPHARAEDSAEERRLLYVAMTRAKTLLYLSLAKESRFGDATTISSFLPTAIQKSFAIHGPSFNQPLLEEIGRILGRSGDVPLMDTIYKQLPAMASVEDDVWGEENFREGMGRQNSHGGRDADPRMGRKRAWEGGYSGNSGSGVGGEEGSMGDGKLRRTSLEDREEAKRPVSLYKEYTTTMEQSSRFTLPGFVNVAQHKDQLTAAAQQAERSKPTMSRSSSKAQPSGRNPTPAANSSHGRAAVKGPGGSAPGGSRAGKVGPPGDPRQQRISFPTVTKLDLAQPLSTTMDQGQAIVSRQQTLDELQAHQQEQYRDHYHEQRSRAALDHNRSGGNSIHHTARGDCSFVQEDDPSTVLHGNSNSNGNASANAPDQNSWTSSHTLGGSVAQRRTVSGTVQGTRPQESVSRYPQFSSPLKGEPPPSDTSASTSAANHVSSTTTVTQASSFSTPYQPLHGYSLIRGPQFPRPRTFPKKPTAKQAPVVIKIEDDSDPVIRPTGSNSSSDVGPRSAQLNTPSSTVSNTVLNEASNGNSVANPNTAFSTGLSAATGASANVALSKSLSADTGASANSTLVPSTDPDTDEPDVPGRPSACFHNTTMTTPIVGRFSGLPKTVSPVRRLPRMAPMDRLRRPFKPLTMNRR